MTTFEDYLRDIHLSYRLEQDFKEWVFWLEQNSDILWELFLSYINKIWNSRKIWKIAYILLKNQ
jgi:hypothetical protein